MTPVKPISPSQPKDFSMIFFFDLSKFLTDETLPLLMGQKLILLKMLNGKGSFHFILSAI